MTRDELLEALLVERYGQRPRSGNMTAFERKAEKARQAARLAELARVGEAIDGWRYNDKEAT